MPQDLGLFQVPGSGWWCNLLKCRFLSWRAGLPGGLLLPLGIRGGFVVAGSILVLGRWIGSCMLLGLGLVGLGGLLGGRLGAKND